MKPYHFPEANVTFAKDQPLPAMICKDGCVVTCWKLTFWERVKLLFKGKLWLMQMTFHHPLQPQLPSVDKPIEPPQ